MCGISQHTYAKDYPIVEFAHPILKKDLSLMPQWARIVNTGQLDSGFSLLPRTPSFKDLETVQRAANRFEYSPDTDNYNVQDYWASPRETETRLKGDCEDIVIWKYAMLKHMGWNADDLNIWAVEINATKEKHMILVARLGDKEYLLNSPAGWRDRVVPGPIEATPEYMNETFTFVYRLNENGWDYK